MSKPGEPLIATQHPGAFSIESFPVHSVAGLAFMLHIAHTKIGDRMVPTQYMLQPAGTEYGEREWHSLE